MQAAVLGSGSWGTALAILLARNGADVWLIGRDREEIESIRAARENLRYLPGFVLPKSVQVCLVEECPSSADLIVVAVPTNSVRELLHHGSIQTLLRSGIALAASKGLEIESGLVPTAIIEAVCPGTGAGALSGPNLAVEVAQGIPTAAVIAFADESKADRARLAFNCSTFRAYRSSDLIGLELAGALKNVIAIAAGMSDGLGFGCNTKGALAARGLREMLAIGEALGARTETFLGIAGVGDLFATASSQLSRNYRVGRLLSEGHSASEAIQMVGQAAEGVGTSAAASKIARQHQLDLPIFEGVSLILQGRLDPERGVTMLMERTTPDERVPVTKSPST